MPDKRKEYAELQKKIKSLRRRIAELEKDEFRHSRIGTPPKSDLLYQALMDNLHLGIAFIDTNHRIITTNATYSHLFKKPNSAFVGKYCFREFEKRKAICPHCPGKQAMATGCPATVETEGVRDDGGHFPVRLYAFPVYEADGVIKGFIEVAEDLTKYKQTEKKLKESEQRFKTIFDNAPVGILLADAQTKKFYLGNKAICKMLGYRSKEIKNLTVLDAMPKGFLSYAIKQFEKLVRREVSLAGDEDIPLKRKDGSVFSAAISAFPITLGGKTYIMGIFRDITAREQAKQLLLESGERLRVALSAAQMGTWRWDPSANQDTRDASFNKILGLEAIESTQPVDDFFQRVHPHDRKMVKQKVQRALRDHQTYLSEFRIVHPDGTVRWLRDRGELLFGENNQVLYMTGAVIDITERKKTEEELNTYRERMARAEQLASLGTLSATLAHELTQPLTVIRLSIENSLGDLEPTSCDKAVKDALKEALNEVINATSVVDRFRNYARQSSRKTLCETNIGAIADRIIKLLGKAAQRAKMTLNLEGMDKLPPVYSNEKDIEQLFFALTENAIQAADGKTNHRLTIKGAAKDNNIELRFADNCSGIAPENLNKIFDPFFTTGYNDGRTGLGLPIVQRILSEYGGKISVRSQLGKGTTFYVTLPIHSEIVK